MKTSLLIALVATTIGVSWRWNSHVAGGSDSYCYVEQAQRWAAAMTFTGPLQPIEPLALQAPWPNAPATFTPVGHAPSTTVAGATVPICPSGLSMAMAPFVVAGGPRAAFLVLPLFAAALVLATYAAGARFGAAIGVAAAALTAASPIVLYQAVQPMSDVPAAAMWMTAVACATGTKRKHFMLAGLAASAAILIRPNLVPLGFAIGLFLAFRPERTWPQRFTEACTYAAWCVPGCVAVSLIQWAFFGAPLSSGYGSFDALFSSASIAPNVGRYLFWLWDSHTPFIALAAAALFVLPGPLTALFLAMFVINLVLYLPYLVFEDWSFLRFLLPTIPLLLILSIAVLDSLLRRAVRRIAVGHAGAAFQAARLRNTVLLLVVAVMSWLFVAEARARSAFRLQQMESRFERAGTVVAEKLPPNALLLGAWQTGSARFYGQRQTMDWTALEPAWLDRALDYLRSRGFEPYFLIERMEEQQFREHFAAASPLGALDWPPAYEVSSQVRIYRPADREAFLKGSSRPTEYVR
jgi:hypothetical protein